MRSRPSYSVLHVGPEEGVHRHIEALLAQVSSTKYRLHWSRTLADAESQILEAGPRNIDLCLLENAVGADTCMDFVAMHGADADFPPMVLLREQADANSDQAALEAGAMDVLHLSDLSPALVERSIRYCVAQHAAKQELVKLATTDALTGTLNRRALYELGDKEFDRATRYGHPLGLLLITVDGFREINDTHGHQVGDKVLLALVATVRAAIRETDVFGRFGGSEFLLILPHTDASGAALLAERIKTSMHRQPIQVDDAAIQTSVNCGLCALSEQTEFFDEMVVRADRSLYSQH